MQFGLTKVPMLPDAHKKSNFPGPGSYEGANQLNDAVVSRYCRLSPKSFTKEGRHNPFPSVNPDVPGPGNYGYTSEFSIYGKAGSSIERVKKVANKK